MVKDAIYTFKRLKHYKPFDDSFFELAKLSIESAKKFYNTILYTDTFSKDFLLSNGLHFDEVIVLEELENLVTTNYGLPKMVAMISRTEPYVHLDFDTILINKPHSIQQVAFAFPEIELLYKVKPLALNSLVNGYLKSYNLIESNLTAEQKRILYWDKVPSNCVLLVNDPQLVRDIFTKAIDEWYKGNEGTISPSVLEQQILLSYLREYKAEYQFLLEMNKFDTSEYLNSDSIAYLSQFDFIHLYDYPDYPEIVKKLGSDIKNLE